MPDIMSYDDWKKRTKRGLLSPRGDELKDVDAALKAYDKDKSASNKKALREAIEVWQASKGPGDAWKTSIRNTKDGAVEELWEAVQPYRGGGGDWTAPALPAQPVKGKIYLGRSFQHANSLERDFVEQGFERAKVLIASAFMSMRPAAAPGWQRDVYTRWFGTYDAARHRTVTSTVNAIHGALHQNAVLLYYRGKSATGQTDCAAENGAIGPGGYFGAAWRPSARPAALEAGYTHIFVGKAYFTSQNFGLDSLAGVIIHELSHAISDTEDVVFEGQKTYGVNLCRNLATKRPDLAVNNADNYEYLCENFQKKNWTPKNNLITLPPKQSVALALKAPK